MELVGRLAGRMDRRTGQCVNRPVKCCGCHSPPPPKTKPPPNKTHKRLFDPSSSLSTASLYKKLSYRRDSAGRRSLRRSRSFNVTDFGNNRKSVCDFLLVNNNNLRAISHCFLVTAHAVILYVARDKGCLQ